MWERKRKPRRKEEKQPCLKTGRFLLFDGATGAGRGGSDGGRGPAAARGPHRAFLCPALWP